MDRNREDDDGTRKKEIDNEKISTTKRLSIIIILF